MSRAGLSYCQVMVGRTMAGLVGFQEILERLAAEGVSVDDPGLGAHLIKEISRHNYVPKSAAAEYQTALLREYRRYLEGRDTHSSGRTWRDPRKEHLPWYPTVFEAKCNECGECLKVCPRGVLDWDPEKTKVLVVEPYECAPGCQFCARACASRAIVLPPPAVLHRRVGAPTGAADDPCEKCSLTSCDSCTQGGRK